MAGYLYEDVDQVNREMHQLNSAMKYGFGLLKNIRSTNAVDDNRLWTNQNNSKWKRLSKIVTPGGAFTQG